MTLLDGSASLSWRGLEIGAEVWNLLDRGYAANEFSFVSNWGRTEIPSLVPARHLAAGPPRTWLFTLGLSL